MPEPIDIDLDLGYTQDVLGLTAAITGRRYHRWTRPRKYDPATRMDCKVLLRDLGEAIGVALDLPRKRKAWTSLEGNLGAPTPRWAQTHARC